MGKKKVICTGCGKTIKLNKMARALRKAIKMSGGALKMLGDQYKPIIEAIGTKNPKCDECYKEGIEDGARSAGYGRLIKTPEELDDQGN